MQVSTGMANLLLTHAMTDSICMTLKTAHTSRTSRLGLQYVDIQNKWYLVRKDMLLWEVVTTVLSMCLTG